MLLGRKTVGTICYMGGVMALPEPFVWAWSQMIQFNEEFLLNPGERIQYDRSTVSYHSFARDGLAENMRGDWILMFDTDTIFEPDIAVRMFHMMNKHKIDVLVALYPYKGTTHAPVAYGYNPKTKQRFVIGDWDKKVDLIPLHSAGAGCLMIRKSVFDKIKKLKESPFSIIKAYSEDNSFFERLHKLKIKAYFSPQIMVSHLAYRSFSLEKDYNPKNYKISKELDVMGFK